MAESVQDKLGRVRPPRVQITYDVEQYGALQRRELPFVLGVLGDFSGMPKESLPPLNDRKFVEIDLDNFNDRLAGMKPRLAFTVKSEADNGANPLEVQLSFGHIDDFKPERIIQSVEPLRHLMARRSKLIGSSQAVDEAGVRVDDIEAQLSRQLNRILHAPEFQQLEAAWRSLHYLVLRTETGEALKIKVLNVSKKELINDFKQAPAFDQSALFKKVYEEPYGESGGDVFGALIGDYELTHHPGDIALLKEIAHLSAMAHAPFIAAARAEFFGCDDFEELVAHRDLSKLFDTPEYAQWKSLRESNGSQWAFFQESDEAHYVGLTIPRILIRAPYLGGPKGTEAFHFEEAVDSKNHRTFLWGNSAFAFGACLTNAFAKYHWCANIRGIEGGGLVEGLPTHQFLTDEGDVALKCPTEIAITDRREKELANLGFIPLVHCKGSDYAAFFRPHRAKNRSIMMQRGQRQTLA